MLVVARWYHQNLDYLATRRPSRADYISFPVREHQDDHGALILLILLVGSYR